jgi:hypothetical protein
MLEGRARIGMIDDGEHAGLTVRSGHGLQIVEALAAAWGVYEGTTHVWADVPLALDD